MTGSNPSPSRSRYLLIGLVIVCAGLALADFLYHKHAYSEIEALLGFYPLFGLIACLVIAIGAKLLRAVLRRDETYYAEVAVDSEEHPEADLGRENVNA